MGVMFMLIAASHIVCPDRECGVIITNITNDPD